jgi:hypothetical protein
MTQKFDIKFSIDEDALIRALIESKGKRIEIIAFGIVYTGKLEKVDADDGNVTVVDGDNSATIEIERIESLSVLEP